MTVEKVTTAKSRALKKAEITEKNKEPRIEMWAKARFHYPDARGGTWTGSPNLKRESFKDGEVYERPLALIELLNENCRIVTRKRVKRNDEELGVYVKTQAYDPRLYFEILERFEKEV